MKLFPRENYLKKIRGFFHADDIIKVITGVRRCGKSCLMQMIAEELRQQGVSDGQIIYLDLDIRKYRRIKTADALENLIDENDPGDSMRYLFIDEIQNVWGRKSGTALMSMIIQLINSSGISIAMVGTEECIPFFEGAAQLARRSQGLKYNILPYDSYFEDFCKRIWQYQYVKEYTPVDAGIMEWLYEHSGGIIANVVSLLHDAQEIAILDGYDKLDLISLNMAYKNRMSFMHKFIDTADPISHPRENKKVEPFEEKDLEEYQSIIDMVETAKNRSVDILDYLMSHIHIEEVSVE